MSMSWEEIAEERMKEIRRLRVVVRELEEESKELKEVDGTNNSCEAFMTYEQKELLLTLIEHDTDFPFFIKFSGTGRSSDRGSLNASQIKEIMRILGEKESSSDEEEKSIIENIIKIYSGKTVMKVQKHL